MTRVSVLIPTFRRPEGFLRAAQSVFAQSRSADIELIGVDNSPEGSALETFHAIAATAPIPFRWTHIGEPGVARARNAALALAQGDLIAWLDDDEEAPPHWLAALISVQCETGANCVFGPVQARAPDANAHHAYLEHLYSRIGPRESGITTASYGIGNSLQPRAFFESAAPFDRAADETGGEDDRLFAAARKRGARFAWAADAWVTEHIGADRARLAHAMKRAFAYGQGPCETAWAQHDPVALARHMGAGAAQAIVYGAAALGACAIGNASSVQLLDRAARGAGKVLWFRPQRFYGAALAARQPA
jgi:glycosyltransferase involved in cell wall biosynthesis